MKKANKLLATALIAGMTLPVLSVNVTYAEDVIVYDGNKMDTFNRSIEEITRKYREAAVDIGEAALGTYEIEASTHYPYCEGVLRESTLKAMYDLGDFCRYIYGSDPYKERYGNYESFQYQALDRNFAWAHGISEEKKPADMEMELWKLGEPCTHNILAWGYGSSGAMVGWINEGYNISDGTWGTTGHRHCILDQDVGGLLLGFSGITAIGGVAEYNDDPLKEAIAAFPAPGYMPSNIISEYESVWQVDLRPDTLRADDFDKLKIKITNKKTGKVMNRSKKDDTISGYDQTIYFVQADDTYNYEDNYLVEITGLTDVKTGKPATLKYEVKFFNLNDYIDKYPNHHFDYDNGTTILENTCYGQKLVKYTCKDKDCDKVEYNYEMDYNIYYGDTKDHKFLSPVMKKAPTANDKGILTYTCIQCGGVTEQADLPALGNMKNPFKDIKKGKYYTDSVLYLNKKGVMTGLNSSTFGFGSLLMREDMVTLLWKNEGKPKQSVNGNVFNDIKPGKYYTDAVAWAKKNDIVSGYTAGAKAGSFGKGDTITRQDFIKIIYGYAVYKGYDVSINSDKSYLEKSDAAKISKYAVDAMNWAYEKGFIGNGSPFNPKNNITRQDAAVIIARFLMTYSH